eukprot:s697_g23.t1
MQGHVVFSGSKADFGEENMAAAGNGPLARSVLQDYKSCFLFLSQEVWDKLTATPSLPALQRADALVVYLVNTLGLRHPSEPTFAVITALIACRSDESLIQLQSLLSTVKSLMKTVTTRARISGVPLPAGTYIESLPNQVDQLPDNMRLATGPQGFAPVPEGIDTSAILQRGSTHRDVQLQRQLEQAPNAAFGMAPLAGLQMMQTAQMAQAMTMANVFAMQATGQGQEGQLNNLQIFGSRTAASTETPRTSNIRTLMDRAEATSADSATAPLLALPAPKAPAEAESSVPTTAVPARDADSTPAPIVAASARRSDMEAAVSDSSRPAEAELDTVDKGPAEPMPSHVSEAMTRLAETYYKQELPDLASPTSKKPEGVTCKRPAAAKGRPRKRPAASTPPEDAIAMKRPAASEGSRTGGEPMKSMKTAASKEKKKKSKSTLVTRQQQLKWRPAGCSRCRHTPGCCPSCWVQRGYRVS